MDEKFFFKKRFHMIKREKRSILFFFAACIILIFAHHTPLQAPSRESLTYPAQRLIDSDPFKMHLNKLWDRKCDEKIISHPVVCDTQVFIPFESENIASFDVITGERKWETRIPGLLEVVGRWKEHVIVRCDRKILALLAGDGSMAWEIQIPTNYLCSTISASSTVAVFSGSELAELDPENGTMKKIAELQLDGGKPTAFAFDGKRHAAFIIDQKKIVVFNVKKQKKLWNYQTYLDIPSDPVIWEKKLITLCEDNFFYCFNVKNGHLIYRKKSTNKLINGSELIEGSLIFSPFASKNLERLNIATSQIEVLYSLDSERYHFLSRPSIGKDILAAVYADFFSDSEVFILFEIEITKE